ncbi:hypothetical protein ACLOJK_035911 [Asimina triloba]
MGFSPVVERLHLSITEKNNGVSFRRAGAGVETRSQSWRSSSWVCQCRGRKLQRDATTTFSCAGEEEDESSCNKRTMNFHQIWTEISGSGFLPCGKKMMVKIVNVEGAFEESTLLDFA